MREKDLPPDEFRCKRTDGRQWRCKRRAMDGRTLCDIHFLQGQHRQNKQKVPESLKLERSMTKKGVIENGESSRRVTRVTRTAVARPPEKRRAKRVSESLDEALRRMKLKRGDLHLDLMRIFLQRQVEKKKQKELRENAIEDEMRELPYGVMAIAQSSPASLQKVPETDYLDVKIGADSNGGSYLQRLFRSKNIEPLPIGTMQVVPFAEIVKKMKIKKCHWCRSSKCPCLIRCLTCRKRFFCLECVKERVLEKQEVKAKCPACHGTCNCHLCMKQKNRANNKDSCRSGKELDRKQLLQYLIHMLLPVLKKVNHDQAIELETESKVTGKEQAEIQIPQSKLDTHTSHCCNKCKASIVDYHRTCTSCSYNLCLSCCWEVSPHTVPGSFRLRSCKKRKISSSGGELSSEKNFPRKNSGALPRLPMTSLQNWEVKEDGRIPCPPTDIGGCGENVLDLRCIFPSDWTRDLEVKAEEILCGYKFPETSDASSCCSLCDDISCNNGESKPSRELNRKIGFNGNYLYCCAVKELQQESIEHFQNHWVKGQPVIIRNVLPGTTGFCWDPVNMFYSYMESKSSESHDEDEPKGSKCMDWCEVESDWKRIFMGSLEKRTHAMVRKKVLKFKAWLSSHLFQKQFPGHYNEILSSLPLPEYINPVSGLLNLGRESPKEFPIPEFRPCIYLSYGGPGELMQADYMSKLCYQSHDMVNILASATDAPISPDQIKKIENLMKKCNRGPSSSNQKGKSPLQSEDTGESGLQDNGEKVLPNGVENLPFYPDDPLKVQNTLSVENGNLSDDGESDGEASILCCGSVENSECSSDERSEGEDLESSSVSEDGRGADTCGAQWDVFPRQDVPKLVEYLRRHSKELGCSKHVHPILDENFFLDAYHKLKLKEEFDVQPWSFEQYTGEAIFIPAGCPYQIRKIKSCVNIVLDFVSPENVTQCIRLNDEIRLLPTRHKAKGKVMEVEKMALHGINVAIKDIHNLEHVDQVCV